MVVTNGTGKVARLPGINVAGKTGTVENYAVVYGKKTKLDNHSVFVCFAPKEDPKIAIAVVVQNSGYGATWAGPVASLMMEKYLFDTVANNRKHLETRLYNASLINQYIYTIDSVQRLKDRVRYERKQQQTREADSVQRVQEYTRLKKWFKKTYGQ